MLHFWERIRGFRRLHFVTDDFGTLIFTFMYDEVWLFAMD